MAFNSSTGKFIYAYKSGSALDSSSTSEGLSQHNGYGDFSLDFSQARGGSSLNPFTADASSTNTSTTTTSPSSTSSSTASPTSSAASTSGKKQHYPFNPTLFAHGLMASLAFVILMPAGAIGIRVLSIPGMWAIHGAIMLFAYVIYIAAFGIGVFLAMNWGYVSRLPYLRLPSSPDI